MLTQYAWYVTDWTLSYVWCQSFLDFFSPLLTAYIIKALRKKNYRDFILLHIVAASWVFFQITHLKRGRINIVNSDKLCLIIFPPEDLNNKSNPKTLCQWGRHPTVRHSNTFAPQPPYVESFAIILCILGSRLEWYHF